MLNYETRLVFAKDIKEYLKERASTLHLSGGNFEAVNQIYKDIDSIDLVPTADAVPVVHGRWIGKNSLYDVNIHICSVCREQVSILGNKLRYCPNCGAKMDSEN